MADYKELLRRAISALPENNGAARRAVYEKARSALVGQLRAITPPLPARDITQHRLQLEDCIRQVEQEASEAVISLGRDSMFGQRPPAAPVAPPPRPVAPPPAIVEPVPEPEPEVVVSAAPVEPLRPIVADATPGFFSRPASASSPALKPQPIEPVAPSVMSIEDIISQAATLQGAMVSVEPEKPARAPAELDPVIAAPLIVAKAEASRSGPSSPVPGLGTSRPVDLGFKASSADRAPLAATARGSAFAGNTALAQRPEANVIAPVPVEAALSSVREVEVEPVASDAREAESVVASAIEALDREARGEAAPAPADSELVKADRGAFGIAAPEGAATAPADDAVAAAPVGERRSGTGLTIFLVVFAVLLAGAGGAGFWAWREGYVDLDQMFGQAQATTETAAVQTPIITPDVDASVPGDTPVDQADGATGPGNTATTVPAEPTTALEGLEDEERLVPTPQPDANGTQTALPSIDGDEKTEDRLPGQDSTIAANDPAASVDPAMLAGSQSLLLEASADGRTGAVPFSGTIAWREGEDELGQPTLIGTASIPARNLGVEVTIRKNSDPSLPASHLMEVDFQVSDTFIGGTIAGLPGVLLKNEELVPGTPLVGASARVVGNSFLFALSAAANDATNNTDLLESRRWMDLAVVYGTGRNAIITLEKDDEAQAMFERVFSAWQS